MPEADAQVTSISDTAIWAATYRADEHERPDAVVRDHLARLLSGERGRRLQAAMPSPKKQAWAWVARCWLFDQYINAQVSSGVDTVLNLAAGLDSRPYRLVLPASLKWIEVDHAEPIRHKTEVLKDESPRCQLERIELDLADIPARRALFDRIARESKNTLVITEGLLLYLSEEQNAQLARDLANCGDGKGFQHWVMELCSPTLLKMLQKNLNKQLDKANAPLKFGPKEGPHFFAPHGWKTQEVRSLLKAAATIKRSPWFLRLLAMLPDAEGWKGSRPWSGVCLLGR